MKFLDKNIKRKSKIVSDTLQFALKDSKIPLLIWLKLVTRGLS